MKFKELFANEKPTIAVIHLAALPGAPLYQGNLEAVIDRALEEAETFATKGAQGIIVENFNDAPFFPGRVPAETIAAMACIGREIRQQTSLPLGVNVLRNDAEAALAIAHACHAQFIRVNVHLGAVVADQGIIQGMAHETLRMKQRLGMDSLIFADVGVKHAAPLAQRSLREEAEDLSSRGLVDALIVSGESTGKAASIEDLQTVKDCTGLPVLVGSGVNLDNLDSMAAHADGWFVGSAFKVAGLAHNAVDGDRVERFCQAARSEACK